MNTYNKNWMLIKILLIINKKLLKAQQILSARKQGYQINKVMNIKKNSHLLIVMIKACYNKRVRILFKKLSNLVMIKIFKKIN